MNVLLLYVNRTDLAWAIQVHRDLLHQIAADLGEHFL